MNKPIVGKYKEYVYDNTEPPANGFYNKYIEIQIRNRNKVLSDNGFYLHMGNGDVDRKEFPIPACLTDTLVRSLNAQYYRYSHPLGRPTTRQVIAEYENFIAKKNIYTTNNVGMVLSATGGFSSAIEILMRHNKFKGHGLITQPTFPVYEAVLWKRFGIHKVVGEKSNGFLPTIDEVIKNTNNQTRFIILTSPSFPFGKFYSKKDLEKIVDFANDTKTYVILDELFYDLPFREVSNIGSVDKNQDFIVRIKGFSKDRAVPGFRAGYVLASEPFMMELNKYANHCYGLPPSLFEPFVEKDLIMRMLMKGKTKIDSVNIHDLPQVAEIKSAIIGDCKKDLPAYKKNIQGTLEKYKENRDFILNSVKSIARMETIEPDAGFNMGVRIDHSGNSFEFFKKMFFETGVILAPGEVFDMPKSAGNWFRLTFSNNKEQMAEALGRIKKYLGNAN